jgi:hypothetical protein
VGMNKVFCTRCGSTSHTAYDCSAPDQRLAPPAAEPPTPTQVAEPDELQEEEPGPPLSARPRHPAWPLTCLATGDLAFDGPGDAASFAARWHPSYETGEVIRCGSCGRWHEGKVDGKRSRYPREPFKPFRRKPMLPSAFGPEQDLPKQPERPAPAPPKQTTPPARKAKKEGMLL